ncbi:hypothetical protein LINGRAHAP2_LOCUS28911 [Linum grandiflorum]
MIFILKEEQMREIPESFVRHRWSKDPKRIETIEPKHMDERQLAAQRYGILQYSTMELFQLGVVSIYACKLVRDEVHILCEKLRGMVTTIPIKLPTIAIPEHIKGVKNPQPVAYKGCGVKKGEKRKRKSGSSGGKCHTRGNGPSKQK